MTTRTSQRLIDYLNRHRSDMTSFLEALAQMESPSNVPESQFSIRSLLGSVLREQGFTVRMIDGRETGGHLLAQPRVRRAGQPMQLLLGHCDTVWPIGTLQEMPVHQRDGRLYGPGVYDMKGGLVQAFFALQALESIGESPQVAPVVFINSDEEIGSPESSTHIKRLAKVADRVYVMEPSLGPSGKLKTARKGVARFTIRVLGRAAHAGLDPYKGASAILELSHVVQQLFALNDPDKGVTVNVGTIDGGLRPNVVAPESRAEADVRVATSEDARWVEAAIRGLQASTPGTQLEVTGGFGRPPMEKTPRNERLWCLAREAADDLGFEIEEAMAGGGSDGNSTSLHAPTLDGLGAVGDGAHAENEHVCLDKMVDRAALLARLMLLPETSE